MAEITLTLPEALHGEVQRLAREGWFRNDEEVVVEAVRRYVESRRPELMAAFAREDVRWGLHGRD